MQRMKIAIDRLINIFLRYMTIIIFYSSFSMASDMFKMMIKAIEKLDYMQIIMSGGFIILILICGEKYLRAYFDLFMKKK